MPKYYCDYCDTFLTHDSPSVRKTHNGGRKHKENVRMFYQSWMEEQAQKLVDATTRAFTQQRMMNPAAPPGVLPNPALAPRGPIPPQMMRPPMAGMPYFPPQMMMPPHGPSAAILPPGMIPPGMRPPISMPGSMPPVAGMPMPPTSMPVPPAGMPVTRNGPPTAL